MKNPKQAGNKSKMLEMQAGDYYWCACGKSETQPFCDGSHAGSEFTPVHVKIEEKKDVFRCMCKHSKNKPNCDGTHLSLDE